MKSAGIKAYNNISVHTEVNQASPHRLIQMLINAAIGKIAAAKGYMNNKKIAQKGEQIGTAISIIDGLRSSLDKSVGGEIALNLDNLYEYMIDCLTEANINNDPARLDEVITLLKPIKEAWDAIPEDIQNDFTESSAQKSAAG
ncbi:MAG: flagellar export chaperone FliS [Thiohalomonadales bacterium]